MTGMRRGEILGLRSADIDLEAARLSVCHAVAAVAYEVIESTPKSHNARVIDLDTETVDLLRAHRRRQQEERVEWVADYDDHNLVASRDNGSPIHPHSFSQSFERLVRRAGIRNIRLHYLRHVAGCSGYMTSVIPMRRWLSKPVCQSRSSASDSVTSRQPSG